MINEDKRGVSAESKGSWSFREHMETLAAAGRETCQTMLSGKNLNTRKLQKL